MKNKDQQTKFGGSLCRCGAPLPSVYHDEVPFEFCTQQCRTESAAADLLYAAKLALSVCRFSVGSMKAQTALRAAIAKAEGK